MPPLPTNYVRRADWGARRATSKTALFASAVDTVVFHYTAALSDTREKHEECGNRVRGIQNYHMTATPQDESKPWADIAYNFLVCKHGYIFEGRGVATKSAATGADNSHTLAVCFLGADKVNLDDVTVKGREALVNVTRWIRELRPNAQGLKGHRDFMSTTCPGDEIYKYIHSNLFEQQLALRDETRLATLRAWILARRAEGWGWTRIKASPNWREFVRRGGK